MSKTCGSSIVCKSARPEKETPQNVYYVASARKKGHGEPVSSSENEKQHPIDILRKALKASRRPDEYAYSAVCLISSALLDVAESRPLTPKPNKYYEVGPPALRSSTGPECARMAYILSGALDSWAKGRRS